MIGVDTTFLIDLEIVDSPRHEGAMRLFNDWLKEKHSTLTIFNQTFLEFQHVITDPRRFNFPLSMEQAVERSWFWAEQERVTGTVRNRDGKKQGRFETTEKVGSQTQIP